MAKIIREGGSMKVEDRLEKILIWFFERHPGVTVDQAKGKIKGLIVESFGEKKQDYDFNGVSFVESLTDWEEGYNQKISELKKIWGEEG